MVDEFDGRLEPALAEYDALLRDAPSDDARFRRAECLGKLGRVAEARAQLAEIRRLRDLTEVDRTQIGILLAVWDLGLGKERRGYARLEDELGDGGEGASYYRALGRSTILEHAMAEADAIGFGGSDRRDGRALEERAALVALAEEQLAGIVRLGETWFALRGFVRLGESYEDLGLDLLAEPLPAGLTEARASVGRDELEERVEGIWMKGRRFYDRGLELAAAETWTTDPVPRLQEGWDRVVARVDELGSAR
jgi:hypothetical protein